MYIKWTGRHLETDSEQHQLSMKARLYKCMYITHLPLPICASGAWLQIICITTSPVLELTSLNLFSRYFDVCKCVCVCVCVHADGDGVGGGGMDGLDNLMFVCFICVLHHFQQSFSHITIGHFMLGRLT